MGQNGRFIRLYFIGTVRAGTQMQINQSGFETAITGNIPLHNSTLELKATRLGVATYNYATISVLTH